jgi:pimeloyl-ACP methyl ester carboxylesterase
MLSKITTIPFVNYFRQVLFVFTLLFVISACENDNKEEPTPVFQYLVSSEQITVLSKETIAAQLMALNPLLGSFVKNGVEVHKITYKTKDLEGKEVIASGAVFLPQSTEDVSLISVQHGTITNLDHAPSKFHPQSEASMFGGLFSGLGYIISYPDYLGYGSTENIPHPYEHRASLASASLDMLRATKELVGIKSTIKWDKKLFLAGYSEGGFASMSLLKKIEEEAKNEFTLKGASCGAGAYDKTAFMNYIINEPTEGIVSNNKLYLWVLLSYNRIYGLNRPMTAYFKEPFATEIAKNGNNTEIDQSIHTIFADDFVKGIKEGTDTAFINAVKDNNVYDWKPTTTTLLVHGDADETVFYFNSVNAYNAMKQKGANVTLQTVPGGTHASTITAYLTQSYLFFENNK